MIVGNGLLAKGFHQYSDNEEVLIFASGVSNSSNTNQSEFKREEKLLLDSLQNNRDKKFVYFSTCSIYDNSATQSAYVAHKLAMEKHIKLHHPGYFIFRVSNPIGKTHNPHTVFNYFLQHIMHHSPFHVWKNAERNIIDIDDLVKIGAYIIDNNLYVNEVSNIANPHNYSVLGIVQQIESVTGIKGNYSIEDKASIPQIDVSGTDTIIQTLGINFDENYLPALIKKYLGDI